MIPVLVISLPHAGERRATMCRHLAELGIPFEFFDAVDGFQLTPGQVAAFRPKRRDGLPFLPGHIGVLASFYSVFRQIAESAEEFACVLEDDAELSPHIHPLLQRSTLRSLGPFDLLKLHDRGGLQIPITQVGDTRICAPLRPGGGGWAQICSRAGASRIAGSIVPFLAPLDLAMYYDAHISWPSHPGGASEVGVASGWPKHA